MDSERLFLDSAILSGASVSMWSGNPEIAVLISESGFSPNGLGLGAIYTL